MKAASKVGRKRDAFCRLGWSLSLLQQHDAGGKKNHSKIRKKKKKRLRDFQFVANTPFAIMCKRKGRGQKHGAQTARLLVWKEVKQNFCQRKTQRLFKR